MICPRCQAELSRSIRAGVEIDTCPNCRGVWLDRGELDKILQRSAREEATPPPAFTPPPAPGELADPTPLTSGPTFPPSPAGPADAPIPPKKPSIWREVFDF